MGASSTFFAATGLSTDADAMQAAEQATADMMAKFKAVKKKPKVVIFIERVDGIKIYGEDTGKFHIPYDIGRAIKKASGAEKVFGTGGAQTYGITWGDLKDEQSSFMVLGLTGKDLEVNGYVDGGILSFCYPGVNTFAKLAAGEHEGIETIHRQKIQRATCKAAGFQLGQQIPVLCKPGFIVLMGALHNNWHVTYAEGLKESLPVRTQVIGGVGLWEDYVYCDGLEFHDRSIMAAQTVAGRIAITIQGTDFQFATMGGESVNKTCKEAIDRHTADVAGRLLADLGGPPDAMIAFSCVTRLRDPKIMDPKVLTAMMHKHFAGSSSGRSDMQLFGCFCGGEVFLGLEGDFTAGGDRLAVAGLRAK